MVVFDASLRPSRRGVRSSTQAILTGYSNARWEGYNRLVKRLGGDSVEFSNPCVGSATSSPTRTDTVGMHPQISAGLSRELHVPRPRSEEPVWAGFSVALHGQLMSL